MRTSESTWARNASMVFIQIFQGTPLLLQLFLIFWGSTSTRGLPRAWRSS
jgi:polar amino acid transport system permease protein